MPNKRLRPPRDYSSRRERFRLFMIVGALFLVIIVFNQARQPEKWRWLTGEAPPADDAELDTRVRTFEEGGSADLPGTIIATNFRFRPDASLDDEARAQRRAEMDIWRQQLESLGWSQRREVARVLKAVRDGQPLTAEQVAGWELIMGVLDDRWTAHLAEAREAVAMEARLSDEDKAAWLHILHDLQKRWDGGLKQALATAADPAKLDDAQRAELQRFEQLYDEMAMSEIRDDTVISRPQEMNAWFRLVEMLHDMSAEQLAQLDDTAAPRVGFRQLHQQPQDYRGKLVKVHGAARKAFRVDAPPNIVGVDHYYVFYILPAGGPTSPIQVYALELPEGFPEIPEKAADGSMTELNEEVEFTGYFFKRTAYLAQDGTRVTPLLVAKSPVWTPREVRAQLELPDWRVFLAIAGGLALLSVGIAVLVYWLHRRSRVDDYGPAARVTPQQFAALQDEPVLPSPSQALAELAQRTREPSTPADGQ